MKYQLVVIGGGPAGLAAAYEAWQRGLTRILILERDREVGGILNQCIHNGFGLTRFKEELTGPEYAARYIDMVHSTGVEVKTDTMVLDLSENADGGVTVHMVNTHDGYLEIKTESVVLAMGCRERTRGAISIPGDRCSGIFTAGAAQRFINIDGYMIGRRVVILGSGDIGLIMARRMTLEGAKVLACVEVMPYSGGLNRNIVQCLNDYNIPLYLSHTVTDIIGDKRLEKVVVSQVDEKRTPIQGTEMVFECDTLLLSVGLIPENELTRQSGIEIDRRTNGAVVYENMETSMKGVFACGNVVHVHDLVDFVSAESAKAGAAAAQYVLEGGVFSDKTITVKNGMAVNYTVPQKIRKENVHDTVELYFRVGRIFGESVINVSSGDKRISQYKRQHMAPGEMERIVIPSKLLEGCDSEITVSAEEVTK